MSDETKELGANSIDAIRPFARVIKDEPIEVQMIGGVCTAALKHPKTHIDLENRAIIAHDSLHLPTIRDDKARTLRDLDILVLSSSTEEIEYINRLAKEAVNGQLDSSVFGLKTEGALHKRHHRAFGFSALKTFLSDRYETPEGSMVKSLTPLSVTMHPDSLQSWTLVLDDTEIQVPHPAMSLINYTNRSISGMRPKDRDKVEQLAQILLPKHPELRDWAVDGPGKSQVELGLLLRSFTPNKDHGDIFGVKREILPLAELAESDHFVFRDRTHAERMAILGVAAIKAQTLSYFESNPVIRAYFQKIVERRIGSIVKND